jgi:hypothetical protein
MYSSRKKKEYQKKSKKENELYALHIIANAKS